MRPLIVLVAIAVLAAGALLYAWHLAGALPREGAARPTAAALQPADGALAGLAAVEGERSVHAVELAPEPAPESMYGTTPPPPRGFEEGGLETAARPRGDFTQKYAQFTRSARSAAAARLAAEIRVARAQLDLDERDDLARCLANRPRASEVGARVTRVLALIDEREWLVESIGLPEPQDG